MGGVSPVCFCDSSWRLRADVVRRADPERRNASRNECHFLFRCVGTLCGCVNARVFYEVLLERESRPFFWFPKVEEREEERERERGRERACGQMLQLQFERGDVR